MKSKLLFLYSFFLFLGNSWAQNYSSYFTGNPVDSVTQGQGGICLMGGASEHDNAMKWFLQRANGGDVLVLRASGSDGYNNYMYTDLGINVNSVESIVFNDASAVNEIYIQDKISKAEAIWFAGGDQWDYISFWRNTKIDSLINSGLVDRNIVIGGTSAGMAIQGEFYFTAENGTITSQTALSNPYNSNLTLSNTAFLKNDFLSSTITDTHFDNPDRKGRLVTFLARVSTDQGLSIRAIACDEYTAVCIDQNGIAKSYGDYPSYDEDIYFIQSNCSISDIEPEICAINTPLTWNKNGEALLVYNIKGTNTASNSFDLNNWKTGSGGTWQYWSVNSGILSENEVSNPACLTLKSEENKQFTISHHVVNNTLFINHLSDEMQQIQLRAIDGKIVYSSKIDSKNFTQIDIQDINNGIYFIEITDFREHFKSKILIFR